MGKFALIEHRLNNEVHWDILFERPGGELLTWQVPANPLTTPFQSGRLLADHRRLYLTYKGPVLLNRGQVQPIDQGAFEPYQWDDSGFCARVSGHLMRGVMSIERMESTSNVVISSPWRFRLSSF